APRQPAGARARRLGLDRRRGAPGRGRRGRAGARAPVHRRGDGRRLPSRLHQPPDPGSRCMKPTIAFLGSSLVSAYWNGAATYYRGIVRGLHERGFDVTFYEPDAYERQAHRDMPDPDWARVVVYPADSDAHPLKALEEARAADIIVKTSGIGVFDALLEAA